MAGDVREPGWYPDQTDPEFNRYWNGRAWTARRHPVGATPPPNPQTAAQQHTEDRPAAQQRTADPQAPAPAKQRIPVWMWVIGALFLLRSVVSVLAAFDHPDPAATTAVPSHPAVAVPSPGSSH